MVKKSVLEGLLILLISSVYFLIVLNGHKQFLIWDQITDAFVNIYNLTDMLILFADFNAHTLRLTLIFPLLIFADITGVEQQLVFSVVVFFLLHATYFNCNAILNQFSNRKAISLSLYFLFILVSLMMNGRIIFSFFGVSLIMISFYKILNSGSIAKVLLLLIFGLWFASVSTGSFSVSIVAIVAFFAITYYAKPDFRKRLIKFIVAISILTLPFLIPLMQINLQKNLEFYDGSFVKMLNHGAGIFFKNLTIIIPLIIFCVLFSPLIIFFIIKTNKAIKNDEFYCIVVPLLIGGVTIGLFGFSSLLTSLPGLFLLLAKNKKKQRLVLVKKTHL